MSPDRPAPPPTLTGQQRRYLRSQAHGRKAIVQVGEAGLSEAVLAATRAALHDHELVKVRLRRPEDKKAIAAALAEATEAALCGVVGHTVILYRRRPEPPRMPVPGLPD